MQMKFPYPKGGGKNKACIVNMISISLMTNSEVLIFSILKIIVVGSVGAVIRPSGE